MARLTVAMIYVFLRSSLGRSASEGLPWKIERSNDGDSVSMQGNVLSAAVDRNVASTETSLSKLHDSELQAEQHVQPQSLFGRKSDKTDNPDGAVVKVQLLSEIQMGLSLVQVSDNQSATLNSQLQEDSVETSGIDKESSSAHLSGDRPSGKDWPWQAAWESAGDVKSRKAIAPESGARAGKHSHAGETEHSELRARKRGQHEASLSRKRSNTDNPNGLVVDVTLNSELQDGEGGVEPVTVNTRRSLAQVSDDEAEIIQNSGQGFRFLEPVGTGSQRVLTQFAAGRSRTHGWPWDSVWNSASDSIGGGPSPSSPASARGARKSKHVASAKVTSTELRAGKHDHQWTLGRESSDTDNPEGAVVEVTLNSELQEQSGAVEVVDGQPSLTQVSDDRSTSKDWPWSSANSRGGKSGNSATHASIHSTSGSRSGHGEEFENSELRAGKPGHHQWSLGLKQDDTDNPEGAVMEVILNSELQEQSSAVDHVDGQPSLVQVFNDRFTSKDWPWSSANSRRGKSGNSATHPSIHSTSGSRSGHGEEFEKSELSAGKPGRHQWSLSRKQNDTDNSEGAVMEVTLNSELQQGSGAVEHLGLRGQASLAQAYDVMTAPPAVVAPPEATR